MSSNLLVQRLLFFFGDLQGIVIVIFSINSSTSSFVVSQDVTKRTGFPSCHAHPNAQHLLVYKEIRAHLMHVI